MILRFYVNKTIVVKNMKAYVRDFKVPGGTLGTNIRYGMHEVYDRVSGRFASLYEGPARRFINYNAGYTDEAAPRVVKSTILDSLKKDRKVNYYLSYKEGSLVFGLGNVPDLDTLTDEGVMSIKKAQLGETPEQRRVKTGRKMHPLWRIIEFGASPHQIVPKKSGLKFLMFFDHKSGMLARPGQTSHPGQRGKHVFLRREHELYQTDTKAINLAISRGLREQIKRFHGRGSK